jgi:hypothetical protein
MFILPFAAFPGNRKFPCLHPVICNTRFMDCENSILHAKVFFFFYDLSIMSQINSSWGMKESEGGWFSKI